MPTTKNPASSSTKRTRRSPRRPSNQENIQEGVVQWAQSFRSTLATISGFSPSQLSPAWPKKSKLASPSHQKSSRDCPNFSLEDQFFEETSPSYRYTHLSQSIISMYRQAQALNGQDLLLNADRDFSDDWAWSRPQKNPYTRDRLAGLSAARLSVHNALSALPSCGRLDTETRLVASSTDIPLWGRLMLQSITIEHWGQVAFVGGAAMPLSNAQSVFGPDEPIVVIEVFGCPLLADPVAALSLSENETAMKSWATSLLDGPFGNGTVAAALWSHPVHPDAMVTPSVLNMLSCLAGEHLVRALGGHDHLAVMKVISENIQHELHEWNSLLSANNHQKSLFSSDHARRIPMVWPGIRCWVGTLAEYASVPDFLARTAPVKPSLRTLAETWWNTRIGERVLSHVPSARVLIRPPTGPPVSRVQSIGWAMFQESVAHVGLRPVNTLRVLSLTDEEWLLEQKNGVDRKDVDEETPETHLAPPPFPLPPGPQRRLRGGQDHCSFSRLEFRDINNRVLARSAPASTFDIMAEYDAFISIVRDEHFDNSGGRSMVRELTRKSGSTVWVRTRTAQMEEAEAAPDDFEGSHENWRASLPSSDDSGSEDNLI
jgi:hypothetical protein